MKQILVTSIALFAAAVVGLGAQSTNTTSDVNTNITAPKLTLEGTNSADAKDYNKIDLTLSSAGTSYGGHNEVGVDFSLSIDPFEKLPDLWVGVSQSLYWQPKFAGSTDIDADWNVHIYKQIYLQGGWSIGNVYGPETYDLWRTGPEAILQYYVSDDVYLYGCVNYDLLTKDSHSGWQTDSENNGWRWSIGLGWEF